MENQVHSIEISKFNLLQAEEEDWKEAYSYRRKMHDAITPDEPYMEDKAWKENIIVQLEDDSMDFRMFIARLDNTVIGICNIAWFTPKASGYEENKYLAFVGVNVLPEYRRKGIGRRFLKKLVPIVEEKNIRMLVGGTIEQDGRDIIDHIGGSEALANIDNRLVMDEIDWDMVEEWAEEGKRRNPETVLEEYDRVPEDRIDAYTSVFDSTLRQVPVGELEMTLTVNAEEIRKEEEKREKTGKTQIKLTSLEPDGSISGLTWLTYNRNMPTILYQGLTGVVEDQRGRGLGKWLKAETLLRARDRYPDVKYIKTHNATSNAPMISINERLGFREFRKEYNLQISVDKLKEYLSKE